MTSREEDELRLREWAELLAEELGLGALPVGIDVVLALAGRVAHAVVRPAAPVSTFLVGYAAGVAESRTGAARVPPGDAPAPSAALAASIETALRLADSAR